MLEIESIRQRADFGGARWQAREEKTNSLKRPERRGTNLLGNSQLYKILFYEKVRIGRKKLTNPERYGSADRIFSRASESKVAMLSRALQVQW